MVAPYERISSFESTLEKHPCTELEPPQGRHLELKASVEEEVNVHKSKIEKNAFKFSS